MKKIYVACAYSDPNENVREERYHKVTIVTAILMEQGYHAFSPITHSHPIAKIGNLRTDWEFWRAYDFSMLDWADELFVLDCACVNSSIGVNAEIGYAIGKGKPVKFINDKGEIIKELKL